MKNARLKVVPGWIFVLFLLSNSFTIFVSCAAAGEKNGEVKATKPTPPPPPPADKAAPAVTEVKDTPKQPEVNQVTILQEPTTATEVVKNGEVDHEEGNGKDVLVLPPAMVTVNGGSNTEPSFKFRRLKDLLFRKKPVFEEMLDNNQRRVLNVADRQYSLKYNSLPVKKIVNFDATPEEESLEIQAFELLGGIVGRAIRNAIICSTQRNSSSRMGKECSHEGLSVLHGNTGDFDGTKAPSDKLCAADDPETANSLECQKKRNEGAKSKVDLHKGPPLENVVIVHSSAKNTAPIRLSPNGGLKEAVEKNVWDKRNPVKLILSLVPFEFLKQRFMSDQVSRQIITALKERYGNHEPQNIVEIQWPTVWPKKLTVIQLAARYMATGDEIARLLLRWQRKNLLDMDKLHIIGFSFGAHLAGIIGATIKEKTGVPVQRITGLDPLGWGFDEMDGYGLEPELDLTKDDATFVDVIHTSSPDTNYPFIHYGSNERRGTVDFYPNNGRSQYCEPTDGLCHHFYSVVLYAASVVYETFNSCKCETWDDYIIRRKCTPCTDSVRMGEHVDQAKANGVYYLVTA